LTEATPLPPGSTKPLLAHPAWTPPALSRGLLYLRGADRLACFRLRRPGG
jgi:hypothetical protein